MESRIQLVQKQVIVPYNRTENQVQPDMPLENPNNIELTIDICESILKNHNVNYKIKNLQLFQRAFVHTSYLITESTNLSSNKNSSGSDKSSSDKNSSDKSSSDKSSSDKSSSDKSSSDKSSSDKSSSDKSSSYKSSSDKNNNINKIGNVVPLQPISYERLEYIGDAILNAATAHYVFQRFPTSDEGFMTTLRTKLVRSKTLARISKKLKFHKYILLSLYTDKVLNGRKNRNTLEDVFEAWIGALYLDSGPDIGFGICLKFITNVFETWIDMVNMINRDDNYKKNLLEYYQKRFKTEAKYQIISVRGKKQHKIYTMGALSPTGEIIGIGQAKNKVDADQMASKQALIYYGEEVEESEEDSVSV